MVLFLFCDMRRYYELLQALDQWFAGVADRHGRRMRCAKGCAFCCHGLFDVSLPDALMIAEGLAALPSATLSRILKRAAPIQKAISQLAPGLRPPYLLERAQEHDVDRIVTGVAEPRCPLLDANNECLIYHNRPLACRLEGVPMVDPGAGLFGDWCELNFTGGVGPEIQKDLVLDYAGIQEIEERAAREAADRLLGENAEVAAVFIPSIVVEFHDFWKPRIDLLSDRNVEEAR